VRAPTMRYLAIDYGGKRTGLAVCDAGERVCSPLCVIEGEKDLIEKIASIAEQVGINQIVLGLPLNMDGSSGPAAKRVIRFAEDLKAGLGLVVNLQDERLTSFGAESRLVGTDFTRQGKRKRLDAIAAAEILQAFLDRRNNQ